MPKSARYTLVWSSSHKAYELHENAQDGMRDILPEGPAWVSWVSQVSSFAFRGRSGSYTASKEYKQRGEGYWYAYARIKGKLIKRYLGRSADLVPSRLEQVAQELWLHTPGLPTQREASFQSNGQHNSNHSQRETSSTPVQTARDQLLATKLYMPRPRSLLVHRPRLIQRLEQGKERALILISAPVGFGKSTLLSDWLTLYAIPTAWLSLDAQDNEPARFLSYLLAALQTYNPRLSASMFASRRPFLPSLSEATLTHLINALMLDGGSNNEHFVLVLDNYQFITNALIHHALSFLIEHLPPSMHLALVTREDPPLPLAQLRGRNNVLELRASDLRFTQEESATFLMEVMGIRLAQEESDLLQGRTEGWITGLQLAAFSLQGRDEPGAFIADFNGSDHYVMDYLLEEVLHRQSKDVQDFLLQTCILDQFSAPLCDAVREQDDSRALIDYLERANLFLVALDNERRWYRYHRLFVEALRQLLQQTSPELVPHLRMRASHWYRQHGLLAEAASFLAASPVLRPTPLIEPLTKREHDVLLLLLYGASNQEIAHELVLSVNTVKKHIFNIYSKLKVRNRVQAIAKARELHLLPEQ